jgi:hypothetical protein
MQQPKHPLLRRGLDHLNNLPQIKAVYVVDEPYTSDRLIADGKLVLHSPQGEVEYIVEIKSNVTLQTLESVLQQLKLYQERLEPGQRMLLVGDRLSRTVIAQLIEKQVEFVDVSGTIYLNNSHLYVLIQKDESRPARSTPLRWTQAHLKIVYVLLKEPKILDKDPKTLKKVLPALAGLGSYADLYRRLRELRDANYLESGFNNKYRITDYVNLLERWEIAYAETLRPGLLIDTFRPARDRKVSEVFDQALELSRNQGFLSRQPKFLIGGELGAAIITSYLHPIKATFHFPEGTNHRELAVKLQLLPDPGGAIVFLKQFNQYDAWESYDRHPLVDPLLIHAELSLETDERVKETAQRLFDQCLAQRAD